MTKEQIIEIKAKMLKFICLDSCKYRKSDSVYSDTGYIMINSTACKECTHYDKSLSNGDLNIVVCSCYNKLDAEKQKLEYRII